MNSAKLLYNLLNVLFILIVFSIGLMILFAVLAGIGMETPTVKTSSEMQNYVNDPFLYIFIGLLFLVYAVFCYGIWNLRRVAAVFLKETFFTREVVKKLSLAGKSFVITGIFAWLIDGLSGIYFNNEISLSLSDKTFTYLFITSVGLFMMLMGTVIKNAMDIKQENDLTI